MVPAKRRMVAVGLFVISSVIATVGGVVIDETLLQQQRPEEEGLLPVVNWQEAFQQHLDEEERQQQDRWPGAPLVANAKELPSFASPADSTILFLHVFKCAGTSLREVFMNFAKKNGWTGAVIEGCHEQKEFQFFNPPGLSICVKHEDHLPIDENIGRWLVSGTKVLAGHFFWDFRLLAAPPYLMVTTLRNPLELFVSGLQFKNRNETQTLAQATSFVTSQMRNILGMKEGLGQLGFIRVFLNNTEATGYRPRRVYAQNERWAMATESVEHLNTFLVVGVVEQYEGFVEVLKHTMDPGLEDPSVWTTGARVQNNKSPVSSRDVLRNMDPYLVRLYNETLLDLQWKVYEVALELWDSRCREVLPPSDYERYCDVPRHSD